MPFALLQIAGIMAVAAEFAAPQSGVRHGPKAMPTLVIALTQTAQFCSKSGFAHAETLLARRAIMMHPAVALRRRHADLADLVSQ